MQNIPPQGRVLDVGAGIGMWSRAFLRDRPDLDGNIDILDHNLGNLSNAWPHGAALEQDFQDFTPRNNYYDGIWADAALHFLHPVPLQAFVKKLTASLKENGHLHFTMIDDCAENKKLAFYGLPKEKIIELLRNNNLTLKSMIQYTGKYGAEKLPIKTYDCVAQKKPQP